MLILIGCNNTEHTNEQTDSTVTQEDENEISNNFYGVWEQVDGEYIEEGTIGDSVVESPRECDRYLSLNVDGDDLVYKILNNDYDTEDELLENFDRVSSHSKNTDYIDEQTLKLSTSSNEYIYEVKNNNELTGYLLNEQEEKLEGSYCDYEKIIDL